MARIGSAKHLKQLYESEEYYDIRIKTEDEYLHCHKLILAQASMRLKKTVDTALLSKTPDVIDMEDHDPKAVKVMVMYIYGHSVHEMLEDGVISHPSGSSHHTVDLDFSDIVNLCLIAKKYGVASLGAEMQNVILAELDGTVRRTDSSALSDIFQLAVEAVYDEDRQKCLITVRKQLARHFIGHFEYHAAQDMLHSYMEDYPNFMVDVMRMQAGLELQG